jgi:small subunit ribosomal protein S6
MNSYELIFIVQPDIDEEGSVRLLQRFTDRVRNLGGQVTKLDTWGRRRLGYPIRSYQEGFYYEAHLDLAPQALDELTGMLKLTEPVLRYLVLRQSES